MAFIGGFGACKPAVLSNNLRLMFKNRKKNRNPGKFPALAGFLYFTIFVFLVNLVFLFFYNRGLGLHFSFTAAFFVLLFVLNYVLSLHLFRNWYFRACLFALLILFIGYALVNFAYFEVFGTFWQVNSGQLKQVNQPLLALLASYYALVPASIYLGSAVFLLLLLFGTNFYLKKSDSLLKRFRRFSLDINFLKLNRRKDFLLPLAIAAMFIALNCGFYFSLDIYRKIIGRGEFSREKYFSDLGLYGNLFSEISGIVFKTDKKAASPSAVESDIKSALPAKSDLELIREDLQKIDSLRGSSTTPPAVMPAAAGQPHVIVYQMESVAAWPLKLDPAPMPFLSRLTDENISADHFFSNSCITVNAEFSILCGFYPEASGPVSDLFSYNNYYCLPRLLKDRLGYQTSIFHANSAQFWNREVLAPRWGFENLYFSPSYPFRLDDGAVLADVVSKIKAADQPTFNYVIGFTSHGPHNQTFVDFNRENNKIEIKPYASPLPDFVKTIDQSEETIRYYLGYLKAIDDGIKDLFAALEKNDLLDNTIVIVTADHRYYKFFGRDKTENFYNYNQVPFAMYVPEKLRLRASGIASHVDIAPSLLQIIGGGDIALPGDFIGESVFSEKRRSLAVNKCLGQSFLIDEDIIISHDNFTEGNYLFSSANDAAKANSSAYGKLLADLADRSDKIMAENKLGSAQPLAVADRVSALALESKRINFNQETDRDKDGLSDLREETLMTDPDDPDTDADGFLDSVEVMFGFDPLSADKL
jgi:hypothetical protein